MEAGKIQGRVGAPWGMIRPFESMEENNEMGCKHRRNLKYLRVLKILSGLWHGHNCIKGEVGSCRKGTETSSDLLTGWGGSFLTKKPVPVQTGCTWAVVPNKSKAV